MLKPEEQATESLELKEECYQKLKWVVRVVFSYPAYVRNLELGLIYPCLNAAAKEVVFQYLVQTNSEFCLNGDPAIGSSAEQECHFFLEMVEHLAHARPVLERTVTLYNRASKPMPPCLREWAQNPGVPPPQKRGPRPIAQDCTALRDHIIALAIDAANSVQRDPRWPHILPVGRAGSPEEEFKEQFSICRAVVEALENANEVRKIHLHHLPKWHLPTHNVVWNAWQRYQNEILQNGKPRPGRPLLPPQGIGTVLYPPGVDTERRNQTLRKIAEDHMRRCV